MSVTKTPAWATGMRKLGPGIYVTANRELHISEREICEHFGVPWTAENVRVIEETAIETVRKIFQFDGPVIRAGEVPPE